MLLVLGDKAGTSVRDDISPAGIAATSVLKERGPCREERGKRQQRGLQFLMATGINYRGQGSRGTETHGSSRMLEVGRAVKRREGERRYKEE